MHTTYGSGTPLLARQNLDSLLRESLTKPITLVWGPSGMGKSTLINRHFAESSQGLWTFRPKRIPHDTASWQFQITDSSDPSTMLDLSEFVVQWKLSPRKSFLLLDGSALEPQQWSTLLDSLWVEQLPEDVHLILLSRSKPKLPLERWRLAGKLAEIGPQDLRLSLEETSRLLATTGISSLPTHAADSIFALTEGWASGILLCSLFVRASVNPQEALLELGHNPHLHEFLQQEVLQTLPPLCAKDLLKISILPQLETSLCEAILERIGVRSTLQDIADRTGLLERLSPDCWRLHPLVQAGLSSLLRLEDPELFRTLHRRAARWNLAQARAECAVRHGLEARDPDVLETVAERALQNLFGNSDFLALQKHAREMPVSLAHDRPFLSLFLAWALFHMGREKEGVVHLERARRLALEGRMERTSRERQRTILAHAGFLRSILLRLHGNTERAHQVASAAFSACVEQRPFLAASIRVQTSIGHFLSGDCPTTATVLHDAMERAAQSGHHLAYFGAGYTLCEVLCLQGNIAQAHQLLERQRRYCDEAYPACGPVSGYMEIARSRLHLWQGSLEDARVAAEAGILLGRRCDNIRILNYGLAARAEIAALTGDLDGAAQALDEAVAVARRTRMHWAIDHDDLEAKRMRLLLSRLPASSQHAWLARTLPKLYQPSLPHWDLFRTAMRLLPCLGRCEEAVRIGRDWVNFFAQQGLALPLQDASFVLALACEFSGLQHEAQVHFQQSLTFGAALGTSGIFLHGPELEGVRSELINQWRKTSGTAHPALLSLVQRLQRPHTTNPVESSPVLPESSGILSEREREVLKAIREGKSNKEIADLLFVAESTVKTHLKNIFVKLGVGNRTHAVAFAQDAGIL